MWMSSEDLVKRARFCREVEELTHVGRVLMRRGESASALRFLVRAWESSRGAALRELLRVLLEHHPELVEEPVSGPRVGLMPHSMDSLRAQFAEEERKRSAGYVVRKSMEIPRGREARAQLLLFFIEHLDEGTYYTASDLEFMLGAMLEDYDVDSDVCHVRRYMQEYAMLSRTVDGSLYWVNPKPNVRWV